MRFRRGEGVGPAARVGRATRSRHERARSPSRWIRDVHVGGTTAGDLVAIATWKQSSSASRIVSKTPVKPCTYRDGRRAKHSRAAPIHQNVYEYLRDICDICRCQAYPLNNEGLRKLATAASHRRYRERCATQSARSTLANKACQNVSVRGSLHLIHRPFCTAATTAGRHPSAAPTTHPSQDPGPSLEVSDKSDVEVNGRWISYPWQVATDASRL